MLAESAAGELSQDEIEQKVKRLEESLADFHVIARVVEVNPGPTVTQFGIEPGFRERRDRNGKVVKRDKVKVSEVTSLTNDLALSLAAPSIRIEAPVPGRHIIGIEIPNTTTSVVSIRQLVESTAFQKLRSKGKLPIALGEDVSRHASSYRSGPHAAPASRRCYRKRQIGLHELDNHLLTATEDPK